MLIEIVEILKQHEPNGTKLVKGFLRETANSYAEWHTEDNYKKMGNIEFKKKEASEWFKKLRDHFCESFSAIDGGKLKEKNGIIKVLEEEKLAY